MTGRASHDRGRDPGHDRGEGNDAWIAAGVALAVRLAVVAWAAPRFPASEDGRFYDVLARRIAEGHGYTWAWPDGVVTPVAHYPVGYPAILGAAYVVAGAGPAVGMVVNAVFGAAAALAVHRLVREGASRGAAMGAAIAVALHPALVPYTAALMTEGIAAALVVVAAALVRSGPVSSSGEEGARLGAGFAGGKAWSWARSEWGAWGIAGMVLGIATLVRPQCLALAPLLGWIAPVGAASVKTRARAACVAAAVALATCLPWTARNCVAMHQCALVSVNGGWNLLIGAQTTSGAWQPVDVPEACRTVWDEAAKDVCFGHAAREVIARAPAAWLARMPAKVAVTLDYFGAAPWYLHSANGAAFGDRAKLALGAVETVVSRAFLLAALVAVARVAGPRRPLRIAIALAGAAFAVMEHGWPAYLALPLAIAAFGPRWLARAPVVFAWTAIVVAGTAATHAVFFGAGRYGLVVAPLVTALAFFAGRARPSPSEASESFTSSRKSASSSVAAATRS